MPLDKLTLITRKVRSITSIKIPRYSKRKSAIFFLLLVSLIAYNSFSSDQNTDGKTGPKGNLDPVNTTSEFGNKKLPGCIIIGVRKGGTRALLEMLTLHPAIRMAAQEVHFFDNETNYGRGYSWYLAQMPSLEEGQIAMEKSPRYMVTPPPWPSGAARWSRARSCW